MRFLTCRGLVGYLQGRMFDLTRECGGHPVRESLRRFTLPPGGSRRVAPGRLPEDRQTQLRRLQTTLHAPFRVAERGILLFRRNGNRRRVCPLSDYTRVAKYSFASCGAGRWKNSSAIHGSRFYTYLSASRFYDSDRPPVSRPLCSGRNPRARPLCSPVPPTLG